MEATILMRSTSGVGRLTLNRPDQRNALTGEMMVLLGEKLRELDKDPEIRCIILDGAGDHFVAGGDITAWSPLLAMSPSDRAEDFKARFQEVFPMVEALDSLSKPLIVAVRGYSVGGGLCFVLAADLVIAEETAKFVFANIRAGINPDLGITYYLPRVIGQRGALRLALLGDQLDAREAKDIGLVDDVVPVGAIETALEELTQKVLAMPARALAETRKLIRLSQGNRLSEQFWAEAESVAICSVEEDFLEAVTAFLERRQPKFGQVADANPTD